MQDSKYLEQLRQELVELSPDFAHDEKNIKQLMTYMLSHKIKVEQDNHFKDQLADRLSRHIAWSQEYHEIDPKVQARTSRLGRFIAYGLPGLALCVIVLMTVPRTPSLISQPNVSLSEAPLEDRVSLPANTVSQQEPNGSVVPEVVSSPKQSSIQNTSPSATSRQSSDQGVVAVEENISPSLVVSDQTPAVAGADQPHAMMMKTSLVEEPVSIDIVQPSPTFDQWQQFTTMIMQQLPLTIELQEDALLDCVVRTGIHCTVLKNWVYTKENKQKLFDEIIKHIAPDMLDEEKKTVLMKKLGLTVED